MGLMQALKNETVFEFDHAGTKRQKATVEVTGMAEPEVPVETYPRLVKLKGISPRDFDPEPGSSE